MIWVKEAAFVNDEEELMRNTLREKIIVINNQIVCATKKNNYADTCYYSTDRRHIYDNFNYISWIYYKSV